MGNEEISEIASCLVNRRHTTTTTRICNNNSKARALIGHDKYLLLPCERAR